MWSLKLSKESFKFSGAHFTTFSKTSAEMLHGHNYYVMVNLIGCEKLNHGMIIDLNEPKKVIKNLLDSLDEKVLIAEKDPFTKIEISNTSLNLSFNEKNYSFPKEDCVLLPLENITIEELSSHVAEKLFPLFKNYPIDSFTVEIAESRGQSCVFKKGLK